MLKIQNKATKNAILFCVAGLIYVLCELAFRGFSHWTMFLLAGCVFLPIGALNKRFSWNMPLLLQILIGAIIITLAEFVTGCIVNLWLGWAVWDYSKIPGNVCGQICPQFFGVWIVASLAIILLDDYFRYWWFGEDKPRYTLWRWGNG